MESFKNFKSIKTKQPTPYKADILGSLKEAVEEINQIKAGKKKGQSLSEFLNEV